MNISGIPAGLISRKLVISAALAAVVAGAASLAILRPWVPAASAASGSRPPSASQFLQKIAQREQAFRRSHPLTSAQAATARKKEQSLLSAAEEKAASAATLTPGISQGTRGGPFHGCQFRIQSEYVSPPAGTSETQTIIFSGQSVTEATCALGAGALAEFHYSASGMPELGTFDAPTSSPLKIISVKANIIDLRSLSGQDFTFNLLTHKYSG